MVQLIELHDTYQERKALVLNSIKPLLLKPYSFRNGHWVDYEILKKGSLLKHEIACVMVPNYNADWDKRDVRIKLYEVSELLFVQSLAEAIEKTGTFDVTIEREVTTSNVTDEKEKQK
jgi:hypothetical protein